MVSEEPSWREYLRGAPENLPYHLAHPEVSFETYVKERKLALGRQVLKKTRIYLDQNYWIYCRQAALGHARERAHGDILNALRHAVQCGKAICPVGHPVLEETLNQSNPNTRAATAKVIDELSGNVVIEPFPTLTQLELLHFIRSTTQGPGSVHAAHEMAWTWPLWVMGLAKPNNKALDHAANLAVQKSFFDATTNLPFSVLVQCTGSEHRPSVLFDFDGEESQRAKTEETRRHKHEFQTFEDVFLIEVAGILDAMKPELEQAIIDLYKNSTGRCPPIEEVPEAQALLPNLCGIIYSLFKFDKAGTALPGIRIMAGIHAAIRYRDQPHKKGDMHDHMNARIALPYCDMFLTEKNLGNLLTQSLLRYDDLYHCRILWRDDQIIEVLRQL